MEDHAGRIDHMRRDCQPGIVEPLETIEDGLHELAFGGLGGAGGEASPFLVDHVPDERGERGRLGDLDIVRGEDRQEPIDAWRPGSSVGPFMPCATAAPPTCSTPE